MFHDKIHEAEVEITLNDEKTVIGRCYSYKKNSNENERNTIFCNIHTNVMKLIEGDLVWVRLKSQAIIDMPHSYFQLIRISM